MPVTGGYSAPRGGAEWGVAERPRRRGVVAWPRASPNAIFRLV